MAAGGIIKVRHLLWAALICGLATLSAQAAPKQPAAKPKITKAEATKTALAKVPNGTVKSTELETEKGKRVWSFDIATPNSKDITEVQVDAASGEVVSVATETSGAEAREKKAEAKEKMKAKPKEKQ
jgi:hypothetical protein